MRCPYCYNDEIVFAKEGRFGYEKVITFLESRVGLLNGVVLSGGEATMHDIVDFAYAIKDLGFALKLDTNGTNPFRLETLLDKGLLDYVALDYKAPVYKFNTITHNDSFKRFSKSLDLLLQSGIEFEVRTTLHNDLLGEVDINSIIYDLHSRGFTKTYYIQPYVQTDSNIANLTPPKKGFDKTKINDLVRVVYR